ncbi:MAG TPA: hypothetical protein VHN98_01830 [Acidimicrobiales bacterium]|nr:hypothetical protein [Acidimicrobiales bacterium]
MNLLLILLLLVVCGAIVVALAARRRPSGTPAVGGPDVPMSTSPSGDRPWERNAEELRTVRPSQAQVGESARQRRAPRTEDS